MQQDVDIGWGILGRLSQGGWIVIEQSDVADHQWRTVHFKLMMSGRVLFRTKVFDTVQDESQFAPLSVGLSYQEAVRMMRADSRIRHRRASKREHKKAALSDLERAAFC